MHLQQLKGMQSSKQGMWYTHIPSSIFVVNSFTSTIEIYIYIYISIVLVKLFTTKILEGMWVSGVSRGLHCGQPAPRILSHGWQIPATQPWPPFPGTRHTEARWNSGRRYRGLPGGGTLKNNRFQQLHADATATKTAQFDTPDCDEAATFHVSLTVDQRRLISLWRTT